MKHFILVMVLAVCACQNTDNAPTLDEEKKETSEMNNEVETMEYDSLLAERYGADDYGMKSYVMAFLKSGPNRDLDSTEAMNLQMAHLKNIERMAEAGKLVVAGPFMGDSDIRGIYIFDVETVEEAEALTATDPAIMAGSLVMELHPWYSSAALVGVNEVHKKLAKTNPWDG